jgi:hypothetical protein
MKNLIIVRTKNCEDKKKQTEFNEKVSIENLTKVLHDSKTDLEVKFSILHAVYFGSNEDLNHFGKELTKQKIDFKIA